MARDEEDEKEEEKKEPAKSGGKKLVIIIALAVLLLLGIGGGVFFALSGGKPAEEEEGVAAGEGEVEEAPEGEEGELPGAILPLETFIVNLQIKGSFLKATMQLQFVEPELPASAENEVPKIRDSIIRILSSKKAEDVLNAEGKERLKEEIKQSVNQTLGAEDVTAVYFTEFIVQ